MHRCSKFFRLHLIFRAFPMVQGLKYISYSSTHLYICVFQEVPRVLLMQVRTSKQNPMKRSCDSISSCLIPSKEISSCLRFGVLFFLNRTLFEVSNCSFFLAQVIVLFWDRVLMTEEEVAQNVWKAHKFSPLKTRRHLCFEMGLAHCLLAFFYQKREKRFIWSIKVSRTQCLKKKVSRTQSVLLWIELCISVWSKLRLHEGS